MFDKTDYDNYCKSYITNMDSNEVFVRTCICQNIRAVYPFSDKRIADTFFGLSAEVRYDVLSRVGWSGTRSCRLEHGRIADGRHDQR
jgi:hypothetical protein